MMMLPTGAGAQAGDSELRGMWVSSVYNLDFPSAPYKTDDELKAEIERIVSCAASCGLNAIFLQVRPCGDALYPSALFPASEYLGGVQGEWDFSFDPLAHFIEQAHKKGVALHAWVNPYRITRRGFADKEQALASLSPSNFAKKNPDYVRFHSDGNLYLDPGIPFVQQHVVGGIQELLDHYAIDGVHFDDYFYPSPDFDDALTYQTYGKIYASAAEFRRASVNALVSSVYRAVKEKGSDLLFGVSPFGIWAHDSINPLGSKTKGTQSYYDHFADSRKWVKEGWLDYIAPQLYWHMGSEEGDFETLLCWWQDIVRGSDTRLVIGLAAYRMLEAQEGSAWLGTGEIERQLKRLDESEAAGYIFFRYGSIAQNAAFSSLLNERALEHTAQNESLMITRPQGDIRTSLDRFYITGSSDTAFPLTVNGEAVTRSPSGYFGQIFALKTGENRFTFDNGGVSRTLLITKLPSYRVQSGLNPYPKSPTLVREEAQVPLSISAPLGCSISALYAGRVIPLSSIGDGRYEATLEMGEAQPQPVLYAAKQRGVLKLYPSKSTLGTLPKAQRAAEVIKESADVFYTSDPAEGAAGTLLLGMRGAICKVENGYAQIEGMGYVPLDALAFVGDEEPPFDLTGFSYMENAENISLNFDTGSACASVRYQGGAFTLRVMGAKMGLLFECPLIESMRVENGDGYVDYIFTLSGVTPTGYRLLSTESGIQLQIKKKPVPEQGEIALPLSGITIMLDAGHGGSANGATGVSPRLLEKDTNLMAAQTLGAMLKELGADVIQTREGDTGLSVQERLSMNVAQEPDLFLSLHSNSGEDDRDMHSLSGIGFYAFDELPLALVDVLQEELTLTGRTALPSNFSSRLYVCRGTHTLSLLVENEYITSPEGFERIVSQNREYCAALASGIVKYFTNSP